MYERLFHLQEEVLKSLANQKRLEIIHLLKGHELTVSEMVAMLGISQTNVSQHLAVLRRLKLVTVRRSGLHAHYRLSDERVADVVTVLRELLMRQHAHDPEISSLDAALNTSALYPIVRDPVCGMRISAQSAAASVEHEGAMHFFCASGCKERFLAVHQAAAAPSVPHTQEV